MKALFLLLAAFRVAFLGDPQVSNMDEVRYAQLAIREVGSRGDVDMVVVLGDLVSDKPELQSIMKASLDSLPCPWVCAPGNHDRNIYPEKSKKRDMVNFRSVMGYVDTTFIFNGVRFICMDDVREGEKGYHGGFRDDQKEWLASVLKNTPKNMKTVISCHIPLSEFEAKDSLAMLFRGHKNVLAVCGHAHSMKRSTLELAEDVAFEEIIAGSLCGSWWRGVKGDDGLPYSIMSCGAPRGYFTADINKSAKNWYSLAYQCTGRPQNEQLSSKIQDSLLVVNVFGGSVDGKLKLVANGKEYDLVRSDMMAPEVAAVRAWNKEKGPKYFKTHELEKVPARKVNSPHVWAFNFVSAGLRALDVLEGQLFYEDNAMKFSSFLAAHGMTSVYEKIDSLCPPLPETAAKFVEGSYPPAIRTYREAGLAAYKYMMNIPDMQALLETGVPYNLYQHNAYISKTHAAHINGMLSLAKADPSQKEKAMEYAKASAEFLLSELEPADAVLPFWPPTYGRKPLEYDEETDGPYMGIAMVGNDPEGADKYRGEVMLVYPSSVGLAFIAYYKATGDARFLKAASNIGDTYLKTRRADGSWPLKMILATGEVVGENILVPVSAIRLFQSLAENTGELKWRNAEDEAFAWIESNPLSDWNWDGQFEDIKPEKPYKNPTKYNALDVMLYLLDRYPGDAEKLVLCRKLLEFSEKRFVVWETPANHPSWPAPSVLEQYSCFTPIDSSSAKMIEAYIAMYRAEGRAEDLAKACALADTVTRIQKESGRIPTFWDGVATGAGLSIQRYDWLNCMSFTADALLLVDDVLNK